LRVARGLSQEALAVDAGVDRTYVSKLERNSENPSVAVLEKLANAMEISIAEFFVGPSPGAPELPVLPKGRRPRS
jgi:transcriptional regulator with XRE-family HTH domain